MKIRLGSMEIGLARYLGLWTVVALVFAVQRHLHDGLSGTTWPASVYLRWSMIQWYVWAALAPLVFRLAERYPLRASRPMMPLLASVGVTFLALLAGAIVSTLFEPSGLREQLRQFIGQHAAIGLLTYWALFALQQVVRLHQERTQRELETARLAQELAQLQQEKTRRELEATRLAKELAQSRLQVLKTQLQPHFLFNTLHAIVTLLDEDTVGAEDMLLRLSELLRAFLEDYDGQEISLRRELALLELYLGIQRKRYGDRLATRIYVAPDALGCAVPSLILQPIVENAIRHGIGQRVGSDRIEIDARREGETLCIEVRNGNSTLEQGNGAGGHGIGLSNTRLRLRELYGAAADLRLDMTWPQGVACRIRIPVRVLEEDADAAAEPQPA